ncbi:hypothetical protein ADUPG1_003961, partial [Aduncisulcus paluster]
AKELSALLKRKKKKFKLLQRMFSINRELSVKQSVLSGFDLELEPHPEQYLTAQCTGNSTVCLSLNPPETHLQSVMRMINASVLIPNKATRWIPATSGPRLSIPAIIRTLVMCASSSSDEKLFLAKKGGLQADYSVSVVLDLSSSTLSSV